MIEVDKMIIDNFSGKDLLILIGKQYDAEPQQTLKLIKGESVNVDVPLDADRISISSFD